MHRPGLLADASGEALQFQQRRQTRSRISWQGSCNVSHACCWFWCQYYRELLSHIALLHFHTCRGFHGICCKHCSGHNAQGRYFPVSAKNLTDSTANSLLTHVMSCSHCPDAISASLAYLGHRAGQQKTEMGGSWKKAFFQKVWDRLHNEATFEHDGDEEESHDDQADEYDDEESTEVATGEEQGERGDQMNALIKAAAIWLTEQDGTKPGAKRSSDDSADDPDAGLKRRRDK